ncbi:MAG: thermonuclease family protein [Verrucomicrobiota bacterium]|nr:thermonuclease family protein [Verrucomicrobiota bacterium]
MQIRSMVFGILATLALGIISVFYVMQSLNEKRRVRVKVLDVVDETRVRVLEEGVEREVVLAGITYPTGDKKSINDGRWMIETVAKEFFFNMEVVEEYQDTRHVTLYALGEESVNELMLRKGYACYSAMGIGSQEAILEAEKYAKDNRIGIWNAQRELFRNAISTMSKAADREGQPVAFS